MHEKLPVYIATQGPLSSTTNDFWEMILQEHCPVIIMLTQLVDGSEVYFTPSFPVVACLSHSALSLELSESRFLAESQCSLKQTDAVDSS